eukprot:TRINITY_DN16976_c0_g1_i1.p1 TRINITY_DN16976_c0_g1~~TRINITY_DN16976_c0_g1_i1.p1  ORF type:complete len:507 (+),score=135.80 TRINITY_DN16976_c0_g1_i1:97-1521(+)
MPRRYALRFGLAALTGTGVGLMDVWYPKGLDMRLREDGFPDTYWAATTHEAAIARPALGEGSARAEVVVVGAGLAGLQVALALAEQGKKVVVVEQGLVGAGASGMSKGLAVAGLQVDEDDVARHCGPDKAGEITQLTLEAQTRLIALIEKYGIRCQHKKLGGATVSPFDPPSDIDFSEPGYWDLETTRRITGSPLYKWGEYAPDVYGLDPLGLTRGLARACESLGVTIYEGTEARTLTKQGGAWQLQTTGGGVVSAQQAVLCGAEFLSTELNWKLSLASLPCYTYMAATEPLGDRLPLQDGGKLPGGEAIPAPLICDDFLALNYFRKTDDGRLLFGALAETYPSAPESAEGRVRAMLGQVYPGLQDVKFDYFWGGVLCMGRNAVPLIGEQEEGLWYATGFGGHGIVPTCMAGTLVSDAIVKGDRRYRVFQESFPASFCYFPFSRLGGSLVLSAFSSLDWLRVRGMPVPNVPRPW